MSRTTRNWGMGTSLSSGFTTRNIAHEAMKRLGVGSASAAKMKTALGDLGIYLVNNYGIKDLAVMMQDQYSDWASSLTDRVADGEITAGHGGDMVSAVNSVLRAFGAQNLTGGGLRINQKEYGLSRGHRFTNEQTAMSREDQIRIQAWMADAYSRTGDIRYMGAMHMLEVAHLTGMREREASRAPLGTRDYSNGMIIIKTGEGAKNNRPREYHVGSTEGLQAAAAFVREYAHYYSRGSLISAEHGGWSEHNSFFQRAMGEARRELGIHATYHGIRHEYAQRTYADMWQARTGVRIESPKVEQHASKNDRWVSIAERTGLTMYEVRAIDREVREDVSACLGHGRIEVTNVYLGS